MISPSRAKTMEPSEPPKPSAASGNGSCEAVVAASAGDGHGLEIERQLVEAYSAHAPGLLRYACLLTGETSLAEDLLQECFLRYFRVLSAGEQLRNLAAWLYRVTRNCHFARQRAGPAAREVALDSESCVLHRGPNPESLYQKRELARQALGRLAPRELECVRLRAEGLSYAEIAEVLNIRSGTVGALLSRAFQKCRSLPGAEEHHV
ncbi:MAG: RNA polymerase sigma factor [Acidobacteria bacterium]|nr:RNA polymerase sigma factor [Acidobacteriota bacterium]